MQKTIFPLCIYYCYDGLQLTLFMLFSLGILNSHSIDSPSFSHELVKSGNGNGNKKINREKKKENEKSEKEKRRRNTTGQSQLMIQPILVLLFSVKRNERMAHSPATVVHLFGAGESDSKLCDPHHRRQECRTRAGQL